MAVKRKRSAGKAKPTKQQKETVEIEAMEEIPFKIVNAKTRSSSKKASGNRKRKLSTTSASLASEDAQQSELDFELDLVATGKLDVEPKKEWEKLRNYSSFVVSGSHFNKGEIVEVNWDIIREDEVDDDDESKPWIARVLEIRAADPSHVYLRVAWFYWPEQLPNGPESYHGQNEIIESNHCDIIDVMTVMGPAEVMKWNEDDDELELQGYYYRQKFDYLTKSLSKPKSFCICGRHQNPDDTITHCPTCNLWMHERCIIADAALRHDISKSTAKAAQNLESLIAANLSSTGKHKKKKKINHAEIMALAMHKPSVEVIIVQYPDSTSRLRIKRKEPVDGKGDSDSDSTTEIIDEDIHCLSCAAVIV
ncbi:hypothetical protein ABW19_dt0203150 [Dactylella cylindrospora]|nr:hypothetical protein ABW19_dt0203150 [Dactylella cylindrospora]